MRRDIGGQCDATMGRICASQRHRALDDFGDIDRAALKREWSRIREQLFNQPIDTVDVAFTRAG
jgi:hypothetical protein